MPVTLASHSFVSRLRALCSWWSFARAQASAANERTRLRRTHNCRSALARRRRTGQPVRVELGGTVSRQSRMNRISCVVLLLLSTAACSSAHHRSSAGSTSVSTPGVVQSSPNGIISGLLVLQDHSGIPGTVTVLEATSDNRSVAASATGAFRIEVPAGAYRVTARSPQVDNGLFECSNTASAIVTPGRTTNVRLTCTYDHTVTANIRNAA
jgi:hypothetical protein